MSELARVLEALLFLSPEPLAAEELAKATERGDAEVLRGARRARASTTRRATRGIVLRELAGGYTFASDPVAEERGAAPVRTRAPLQAHAGAGRDARDRRLPAAGLAARRSRASAASTPTTPSRACRSAT